MKKVCVFLTLLLFCLTACGAAYADFSEAFSNCTIIDAHLYHIHDHALMCRSLSESSESTVISHDIMGAKFGTVASGASDIALVNGTEELMLFDWHNMRLYTIKDASLEQIAAFETIPQNIAWCYQPVCSDGSILALLSKANGTEMEYMLYRFDIKDGSTTLLPPERIHMIAPWTDGRLIAMRDCRPEKYPDRTFELITFDVNGENVEILDVFTDLFATGLASDPQSDTIFYVENHSLIRWQNGIKERICDFALEERARLYACAADEYYAAIVFLSNEIVTTTVN